MEQQGVLAFLPWIHIEKTESVGRFALCPYLAQDKKQHPKVHELVSAFRDGSGNPLRKATLIAVDGKLGSQLAEDDIAELFALREALAFASLRQRKLFDQVATYVNDHHFRIVVQGYTLGSGGVSLRTRRRDGETTRFIVPEVHEERCPYHVSANVTPNIDMALVEQVLALLTDKSATCDWLADSLELFNLANTDSPQIQLHTELVITTAALQRAMGSSKKSKAVLLAEDFERLLALGLAPTKTSADAPKLSKASAGNTVSLGLRGRWFYDLYSSRGSVAHGMTSPRGNRIWNMREHLLLASFVTPLLIMCRLEEVGARKMSNEERDDIACFDSLLCLPDVHARHDEHGMSYEWNRTISKVRRDRDAERIWNKVVEGSGKQSS